MFGIEDISRNAEFRELPDGHSYRIIDLDWDGFLCTLDFELREDKTRTRYTEEGEDVIINIIEDILNFDYFVKIKVDYYNPNYCIEEKVKNIYRLNFTTEEKKLHPIIELQKYCNGHNVIIQSGDLKDSVGAYRAKLDDIDERGFTETVTINSEIFNLSGIKFEFQDGNVQLCWCSIMED